MACVCHLKIWLCVPNENTSSILSTVKRFDGKESSCKGSVRFSILCVRFSVLCVQFYESRYFFEKRVLTIVKNCKYIIILYLHKLVKHKKHKGRMNNEQSHSMCAF